MTDTGFTNRQNAKRAAERELASGEAPAADYRLHTGEDGRIHIIWHTVSAPKTATEAPSADTPSADTPSASELRADAFDAEFEAAEEISAQPPAADVPIDPFPPGTTVAVSEPGQISSKKYKHGIVQERLNHSMWLVLLDGNSESTIHSVGSLSLPEPARAAAEPHSVARRQPARRVRLPSSSAKRAPTSAKPRKDTVLDEAAAKGIMPTKPVMTSKANPGYQKRFDQLETWALAGEWDSIRAYEVKGINSYAQMVAKYRDRLLAAHATEVTPST